MAVHGNPASLLLVNFIMNELVTYLMDNMITYLLFKIHVDHTNNNSNSDSNREN